MASTSINVASLHAALDAARSAKDLSWRQLAGLLDLSPSTLSRLANGYTPDTAAFTTMVTWLNIPAEQFIKAESLAERGEPDLVAKPGPTASRAEKTSNQRTRPPRGPDLVGRSPLP